MGLDRSHERVLPWQTLFQVLPFHPRATLTRAPEPGGSQRPPGTNPADYGSKRESQIHSICDFGSSKERAGPQNRRPPGREPSSWRAIRRPQFHPYESALSPAVGVRLAGFESESWCQVTAGTVSRQGLFWSDHAQSGLAEGATYTERATSPVARQFAKDTQIINTMVDTQPAMTIIVGRGFLARTAPLQLFSGTAPPEGCKTRPTWRAASKASIQAGLLRAVPRVT